MKKKITVLLLALILLGSVSTLILYNIGGYFLDSALDMVNTVPTVEKTASPDESAAPSADGAQSTSGDTTGTAPVLPENSAPVQVTPETTQAATEPAAHAAPSEEPGAGQQTEETLQPEATPDVSADSADETNLAYSTDEVTEIKDSITAADKISASVLVLSNLSAEDIQYLYGLLEGGLTAEEKAAAKELCYSRFSEEEVAQIYELYLKYSK